MSNFLVNCFAAFNLVGKMKGRGINMCRNPDFGNFIFIISVVLTSGESNMADWHKNENHCYFMHFFFKKWINDFLIQRNFWYPHSKIAVLNLFRIGKMTFRNLMSMKNTITPNILAFQTYSIKNVINFSFLWRRSANLRTVIARLSKSTLSVSIFLLCSLPISSSLLF